MNQRTVSELFDLSGKTALITGGTGYLGTAFSQALAEVGASVVISSRDAARAQEAADKLPIVGEARHHGVSLDQTDAKSIRNGFQQAIAIAGAVDIVINNGLAAPSGGDLTSVTFEDFAQHQINNAGYFELARHLRDHVVSRSASGNVTNIGSMYGQVASYPDAYKDICAASPVAYHALKGGTIHMTRHLAAYWADDNVRVNCLSPGPFPNPDGPPTEMVERLSERLPMKRMGLPWELKGAIVFLSSDASSYVTGQNLTVDGGWTAW
ncbi:MAG: SDR family oxidoreductase [Fuerstiella sp.]|nr:SDR family oxidoreductase [Fuerstiella sp.]